MASPVLLFMIVSLLGSTKATGCKSSTVGREFIFGILDMIDNCCHDNRNIIALDITNVSPNDTRVRLLIPYFNNNTYFNIPSGGKKTLTISPNIQRDGTFKDSRGIIITSESEISVLVTNAFDSPNAIDAYNILPVTEIGNNYTISSYFGRNGNRGSVILVAAVKDNTQVVFQRGSDVLNTVNLKAFEIYQYLCDQCDLTGVRVISNNNVYVVSGSTYTNIPASNGYQQYIASEMLPTLFWSKNYIIPPVLPKTAFMIRILSESSADVIISNITRTYRLSASSVEQYFGTETVLVTSEHPFSVTQYGVNFEYDYVPGDPFMTVVPSVDQYISSYTFTVPHGYYGVKHYTAIIVPKSSMHGLVLDGVSIQSYNATSVMVPAPFDNYTILTLPVKEGYHNFYHQHSLTFGVFMYGHGYDRTNEGLSYGFYAGFSLRGDCSTSTTSTTSSTVTSTSTSQTTSATTSSPTATFESSSTLPRGLTCYSCDDLSDINLCDTVKQCNKHEVCSVARFLEGGQTKYKSGCLQENICEIKRNDSRHSDALCFECCHGDYCNNKGCGENGIPDRDRRGPICFECQHVSSPEQCVKISPCESHQMCHIEEYKWFDHSHFKLGCGHGLCYPVRRMGSHVFKRETPVCHTCCSEDYCNRNCTTSSQGQTGSVIVGTVGKEFVFGILDSIGDCCHDSLNIVALDITNVSPNDTSVRLQIPYFNNDTYFDVSTGDKRTITIDPTIQKHGTFVENRGIKISSNDDISVLVSNAYPAQASIDSYNILPTSNLGNDFILSSHGSVVNGRGGIVTVSAVKNNTNVTLVNVTQVLQTAVINLFEVYQFRCSGCDITGVTVISDKNVFIVSGSSFTQIPASSHQDEYIASEMFPVSTWSNKYIVSPVLPKPAFMLRLISVDPFFNATISNITRSYTFTKSLSEQYFATEPVVVTANHRFSLTQYGIGFDYDTKAGDPFMTLIPGVDQYLNEYTFSVPHDYYDVKSYVAITVPSKYQTGLVLDGVSVQIYNNTGSIKTLKVPKPFDNYTIFIFSIDEGYHHFFHSSSSVKFGVFVYGLGYYAWKSVNLFGLSYGFYAGFNLKGDACSELTPLSTSTHLPTTIATSTHSSEKGPMCYNCDDHTDIGLCDTVHQCKRHEVCYTERYMESGQLKYRSGCTESNCHPTSKTGSHVSKRETPICHSCCTEDYCNRNCMISSQGQTGSVIIG